MLSPFDRHAETRVFSRSRASTFSSRLQLDLGHKAGQQLIAHRPEPCRLCSPRCRRQHSPDEPRSPSPARWPGQRERRNHRIACAGYIEHLARNCREIGLLIGRSTAMPFSLSVTVRYSRSSSETIALARAQKSPPDLSTAIFVATESSCRLGQIVVAPRYRAKLRCLGSTRPEFPSLRAFCISRWHTFSESTPLA